MIRKTLAVLALVAVAVSAEAQTTANPKWIKFYPSGGGASITGTNAFSGQNEFSGQTNISGPDATTNVEIGSVANDANGGTGGTNVAIGNSATAGTGANNVAIGSGVSTTGNGGIAIGRNSVAGTQTVSVGDLITTTGANNVAVGNSTNAGTGGSSVVVGNAATNAGNATGVVNIGNGVSSSGTATGSVVIGNGSGGTHGTNNVVIGNAITSSGVTPTGSVVIGNSMVFGSGGGAASRVVVIGNANNPNGVTDNVILGSGLTASANGQFIVGNTTTAITDAWLGGKGISSTAATAYTINGTGGSGSNNAGAAINVAGGKGTGTAAGGDVVLQRAPSVATGATIQTLRDAFYVRSQFKVLTPATATAFARVNLPQASAGLLGWYGGTIHYTIIANTAAAAVVQTYTGMVNFSCNNLAGAETCVFSAEVGVADNTPTGAITAPTFDANAGTDTIDLRMSTDSDQTETTLGVFWSIIGNGTATITPQ